MRRSCSLEGKGGPRDYLPTLDGWRAIAISLVLFCHVRLPGNALEALAPYGALGVHLFFAISGFLITNRLLEEEHASGRIRIRSFYIRRAFRILPAALLYLAALCVLGFGAGWIPLEKGQVLASALFFRNYWVEPAAQSWYTGHYWSLSVEEHFYLLWPAVLIALATWHRRWAVPSLALAFAVWRALDTQFGWIAAMDPAWKDLVERSDYRMDALLWGCSAAILWDCGPFRARLSGHGNYALLAIGAMVLCLIIKPPGYVALLALLMPVPLLCTTADPDSWLGAVLECRILTWLGRLSYSVYLWQMLFLPGYGIPISLGRAQQFPWNLMLVLVVACASYYFVERPARRFGRSLAEEPSATAEIVSLQH